MKQDGVSSSLACLFPREPRLPLWLKLLFTGYMAVLVPIYWRDYGPANFLYFCDAALFFALAALWLESPLLASAPLVGIFLPQVLWIADFLTELAGGQLTGLTHYMFEAEKRPLFTRLLSFFHFWLPLLLLGLVWRLGYDRRAFPLWTVLAWVLMGICYLAIPGPPPPPENINRPVNINYVYGFSNDKPQDWLEPDWYFAGMMAAIPVVMLWPSHILFAWLFTKPRPG